MPEYAGIYRPNDRPKPKKNGRGLFLELPIQIAKTACGPYSLFNASTGSMPAARRVETQEAANPERITPPVHAA